MPITKCEICGIEMEYKTKPQKLCIECKKAKEVFSKTPKKYKPKHEDGELSQRSKEKEMFKQLDRLLLGQYYIRNGYYSFLMSPKGEPMQLDIYYPQLRLAFEYDGSQHKKYNSYFFKNKKQFEYLQRCDRLKNRICKEIGIELIRINYDKKITLDYIAKKLQDAGYGEYIKDNYEREKQKNK